MKVEEREVEIPRPPKLVILTLTQEEAGALWRFVNYYADSFAADYYLAYTAIGAVRCRDLLNKYQGKCTDFTKVFNETTI